MEQMNDENGEMQQAAKNIIRLLDSYFENCHNAPGKDEHGRPYVLERKTTFDIVDELRDMLDVPRNTVFDYLCIHNYQLGNESGSLKWRIYREVGKTIE